MRKAVFLFFLLAGVGAGLLSAAEDGWDLRIFMMGIGALCGGLIGGVLSQIGTSRQKTADTQLELEAANPTGGLSMSRRDVLDNYSRDEGHAPFMKPPRSELGNRMFDADKWN